ncbi:MAG: DNA polymerase III subunit beta [Moraxella sp.]|nr:DNA polymerase III subunit beta [Moraxella sp.]
MHLQLAHDLLFKATDLVAKVADKHHRFVILGNIKIDLNIDTLTLTASDLEVELTTQVKLPAGACVEAGSITLPAGKFHEICKSLPAGMVKIHTLDHDRCQIVSGKSKFTLSMLPANDFPSIGTPTNQSKLLIARGELLSMIAHTRFAIATQDVRHYLTGMLFHVNDGRLTAVATDGHRLSVAHRDLVEPPTTDSQIIIPGKAIGELERLFNELGKTVGTDEVVSLGIDGEFLQVALNFGKANDDGMASDELTVALTARLIEGKFPDYKRVLPDNCDRTALIQKDDITDVLRRVSILSNERSRGVVFEFSEETSATVRSSTGTSSDSDEAIEILPVNYQGQPIELSLNETYLKAVFGVLQGEISLQMSHPNAPTLITQVGDERHQYVVMPMRI